MASGGGYRKARAHLPRVPQEVAAGLRRRADAPRDWENNGVKGRRTEIVAARVQFLGVPLASAEANDTYGAAGLVAESEPF
jgi:hypothetical protein